MGDLYPVHRVSRIPHERTEREVSRRATKGLDISRRIDVDVVSGVRPNRIKPLDLPKRICVLELPGDLDFKRAVKLSVAENNVGLRELPVSLRSGAVRCELPRIGSRSCVFRKQGIHIVANPVTEVVADSADFIEPGD